MLTIADPRKAKASNGPVDQKLINELVNINRLAKQVDNPATREILYQSKNLLLNHFITTCNQQDVGVDYQYLRQETFVLVRIYGSPTRAFHIPFSKLSAAANRAIVFELGMPVVNKRK